MGSERWLSLVARCLLEKNSLLYSYFFKIFKKEKLNVNVLI